MLLTCTLGALPARVPCFLVVSQILENELFSSDVLSHIYLLIANPNVFSIYSTNKRIGLAVPVISEGTVYCSGPSLSSDTNQFFIKSTAKEFRNFCHIIWKSLI